MYALVELENSPAALWILPDFMLGIFVRFFWMWYVKRGKHMIMVHACLEACPYRRMDAKNTIYNRGNSSMYLSMKKIKTIIDWLFLPLFLSYIYFGITNTSPSWYDYFLGVTYILAAIRYWIDYFMGEKEKNSLLIVAAIFVVIAILIFLIKPIKSGII
jgi:hypothetical protein